MTTLAKILFGIGQWITNSKTGQKKFQAEFEFPFKTRDEYLKWVTQWKLEYKTLADKQRELRKEIRSPHIMEERKSPWGTYWLSSASGAQGAHACNRPKLTEMIRMRVEGKKASWKMKQAAKEASK